MKNEVIFYNNVDEIGAIAMKIEFSLAHTTTKNNTLYARMGNADPQ